MLLFQIQFLISRSWLYLRSGVSKIFPWRAHCCYFKDPWSEVNSNLVGSNCQKRRRSCYIARNVDDLQNTKVDTPLAVKNYAFRVQIDWIEVSLSTKHYATHLFCNYEKGFSGRVKIFCGPNLETHFKY